VFVRHALPAMRPAVMIGGDSPRIIPMTRASAVQMFLDGLAQARLAA
jgi:hypothetical protein